LGDDCAATAWSTARQYVDTGRAGTAYSTQYRDESWIASSWYGNDRVRFVLACPPLLAALTDTGEPAPRWRLLRIGLSGYALCNYAFHMLGARMSEAFLLYVNLLVPAAMCLALQLEREQIEAL
jgi:hypothetical protein